MSSPNQKSFTLIELLIAMIIIGILAGLIAGSFFTSLKKGRDARRKVDLEQVQRAIEMFYEDKKAYPTTAASPGFPFGNRLCETSACMTSEKTYMQRVPNDPVSGNNYQYVSDGTYYQMYTCIENNLDQSTAVTQKGYENTNCGSCGACKFTLISPNTTPAPTLP